MKNFTTFQEHLAKDHGQIGTGKSIGELIKEARKSAKMTQEQLAKKVGTSKTYLSRLENGKSDIQLQTLFRIVEVGLEKELTLLLK